jgi:Anti-sigma-K factor rskA
MTPQPDFRELVGEDLPAAEEERLRHVHDLLLEAGPLPELPPSLATPPADPTERRPHESEGVFQLLPRRRIGAALALAAAIALVAFFGGYLAGYRHQGFSAQAAIPMHGRAGANAAATIKVGKRDGDGNWPLQVEASGLPKLKNGGYYEMFLIRGNKRFTCGTFAGGGAKKVTVRLTIPYDLRRGDGWIVTAERGLNPGRTILTT